MLCSKLKKIFWKIYKKLIFFIDFNIADNILNIKRLKQIFKDKCKVIAVSTEIDKHKIIQMQEMGADNIIIKPVSINSLIQKIALTSQPNNEITEMINKTKKLAGSGNFSQAQSVAEKIIQQKPDSAIAYMLKGDIEKEKGNYAEAESFYTKACEYNKLFLEPLKRLAKLYKKTGEQEKEIAVMHKLDRLSPLNYERKIEIGEIYVKNKEIDIAKDFFDRAVVQAKKQSKELVSLVCMDIANKAGKENVALRSKYITQAISKKGQSLSVNDLWMINELGVSLREEGKWEEAISYYQKGLSISPNDSNIYYNIGMAYAGGKKFEKALNYFNKAVKINPKLLEKTPNIPYNIAIVCKTLRRFEEMNTYLKKALQIDPAFAKAKEAWNKHNPESPSFA